MDNMILKRLIFVESFFLIQIYPKLDFHLEEYRILCHFTDYYFNLSD